MDLTLIIGELTSHRLKLDEYNSSVPIVFVEAKDPDQACNRAVFNLIHKILLQDESLEVILLCKRLVDDIRISRVHVP